MSLLENLGYEVIEIPEMSVEERLKKILNEIKKWNYENLCQSRR